MFNLHEVYRGMLQVESEKKVVVLMPYGNWEVERSTCMMLVGIISGMAITNYIMMYAIDYFCNNIHHACL